jgi:hypothetical protein
MRSGNPCPSDFVPANKINAMTNGTSLGGDLEPLVYRLTGLTGANGNYLGWDIFGADYSVGILQGDGRVEWRRQPRWLGIAPIHCIPVVQIGYDEPPFGVVPEQAQGLNQEIVIIQTWPYNTPLGGATTEATRTLFEGLVKNAIVGLLNDYFPPSPPALRFETNAEDHSEGIHKTGDIKLKRLGILLSAMRRDKATNHWAPIIAQLLLQAPPVPGEESEPEPETTAELEQNIDNFESYPDGVMGVMNGGHGWGGAWVIENLYPEYGLDDFESYDAGAIEDTVEPPLGLEDLYTLYEAGDGWGGHWVFETINPVLMDDFESYPVGEMDPVNSNGGEGWAGPWDLWPEIIGIEDFEGFSVGTFDSDSEGASTTGFIETWVIEDIP